MEENVLKSKREFYNSPWFWIIVAVVALVAIGSSNNSSPNSAGVTESTAQQQEATMPVPAPVKPSSQSTPKKAVVSSTVNNTPVQTTQTNQQTYTTPTGAVVNSSGNVVTPPPAPPASWHPVQTFSGSGDTNTNTFSIQGSKWRIDWSITPSSGATSFCQQNTCGANVQIYQDDGSYVDQFMANGTQTTSGTSYEYGKTGNFYLTVVQGNVSWNLSVEDYY